MLRKTIVAALVLAVALSFAACSTAEPVPVPTPSEEQPAISPDGAAGGAAGSRLAPGLYEIDGGLVQALGTLEWVDLEGGFWAIKGGFEAEGTLGETVAVIANGPDFETDLKALEGKTVLATGTRLDGASVRMAGPEIEISKVEEISDTPGIAE